MFLMLSNCWYFILVYILQMVMLTVENPIGSEA
jgi:hypothetical protein